MNIFIIAKQKIKVKLLHGSNLHNYVWGRIKFNLLASEGWSLVMNTQALRFHKTTVDSNICDYLNKLKFKHESDGSYGLLMAGHNEFLINHLSYRLFHQIQVVVANVDQSWGMIFYILVMRKLRQFKDYLYKKPKKNIQNKTITSLDSTYTSQITKLIFIWTHSKLNKSRKIIKYCVKLNILGTLNLNEIYGSVIQDYQTIDELSIFRFLNEIKKEIPNDCKKTCMIFGGTSYNQSKMENVCISVDNIEQNYLQPWSLSVNEQLQKVIKEHTLKNIFRQQSRLSLKRCLNADISN